MNRQRGYPSNATGSGSYNEHHSKDTRDSGVFRWNSLSSLATDPQITVLRTYSYVQSSGTIDMFCPAWGIRTLQVGRKLPIELSLERSLEPLQTADGGFLVNAELVAALGLPEAEATLRTANSDADASEHGRHPQEFGALLALKTAAVFKPDFWEPRLNAICLRAEAFCCREFKLSSKDLWTALDMRNGAHMRALPAPAAAMLEDNFSGKGKWPNFELHFHMLPKHTMASLRSEGGFMCPRFFLVDLASSLRSPYEIRETYPLFKQHGVVFVGQPPEDTSRGGRDAQRQGHQLEAAVVSFGWTGEDRMLCELRLPGVRAVYAAAPDALKAQTPQTTREDPCFPQLVAGDTSSYTAAGYKLHENVHLGGDCSKGRVWLAERRDPSPHDYWEVKKTTHLRGQAGQFKQLKYWMQAALARCGGVVVATTDGSYDGDSATALTSYAVDHLRHNIDVNRVWDGLSNMLRFISSEVSDDGPWTLTIRKERGRDSPVHLSLEASWRSIVGFDESSADVFARLAPWLDKQDFSSAHVACTESDEEIFIGGPLMSH